MLGVNFGRLGYLPDLLPDQVRGALDQGLRGQGDHRVALRARRGDLGPFPRRWHHGPAGAQRGGDREDRLRPHRPPGHLGRRRGGADLFGRRPHRGHPDRLDRLQPLRRRADPGPDAARHGGDAGGPALLARPQPRADRGAGGHRRGRPRPGRRARHRRAGDRAARARATRHLHRGRAPGAGRAQRAADLRRHPALPAPGRPGPRERARADRPARARPRGDRGPDARLRARHDGADRRDRRRQDPGGRGPAAGPGRPGQPRHGARRRRRGTGRGALRAWGRATPPAR